MAKTIIDAHNISKIYNKKMVPVKALQDVHVHIEAGEFVALVGPSGSGKSTLLNMMGGLDKPTLGTVIIDNIEITKLSENKLIDLRLHNIGFVFQSFNLIPVLTSKENIGFVLQLQNVPKKKRRQRVMELLKEIGLEDKMDNKPGELSGGQQQRVAVARALASKPKIVLADEPTANLDSISANKLMETMAKLNREENITFLFSTHDPRVIKKARRVITLVDGRVDSDEEQIPT
ncbi:ABC transporter ATP-binding protein [Salegentibacter sediminis]|uniref:ABC transporter ATP-binding protein n=1 Tax=Salegentibacter sediminis TaxID=1930251 RepID=UPI0009BE9842|nr:ABC transporter ATP-binding protein [Salegentibacter sediminis]